MSIQEPHPFSARRRAGVLLHPTALPDTLGNGDLGTAAQQFINFLADSGVSVWQMLPVQQPPMGFLSPYQCQSVYAGNRLLISLEDLVTRGWLSPDPAPPLNADKATADQYRLNRLQQAYQHFLQQANATALQDYAVFNRQQAHWLDDYALFAALKAEQHGHPWWQWPTPLRDRESTALQRARARLDAEIAQHRFEQFSFFQQWQALKAYAKQRGVYLLGDVPIFVAEDSAEVWACRDLFLLDDAGRPTVVAGVPPDYFSATGQRWGNPLYHWQAMEASNFQWWIQRFKIQQLLFDAVRIDHFRGFVACWEIPASCPTAVDGHWVTVPGQALFEKLQQAIAMPLIAEDLGVITQEVVALREAFGFAGMKILQFAFDSGASNPYLPHNHTRQSVVYTGTHDNDTTLGWFQQLSTEQQQQVCNYLQVSRDAMPWALINSALASVAQLAIIPMQDILGLGTEHRMNTPGTVNGNWQWRFAWSQLTSDIMHRFQAAINLYGRSV